MKMAAHEAVEERVDDAVRVAEKDAEWQQTKRQRLCRRQLELGVQTAACSCL